MNANKIFYRFNLLIVARVNLSVLRNNSSGPEQALYRALLQDITDEMESLIPKIREIFKRINNRTVIKDIMAIYFEDMSYEAWAKVRGVSVETIYRNIKNAFEAIDCEIEEGIA